MMRTRVGRTALRFAQGPGRQSGAWAASAAAVAGLPFLALMLPDCATLQACGNAWDEVLFIPRLLFLPAAVLSLAMFGSWWAQRRHARMDLQFFTGLEARSDQPDRPPGDYDASALDADLAKRTLRNVGQATFAGGLAVSALGLTTYALRRCDPWSMDHTGLPVCADTIGWTDMMLAMEVWAVAALAVVTGFIWMVRSTSIIATLPRRSRPWSRLARRSGS